VESSGFGLVGMRERVRLLGGRLDAGPTDGGGFVLTARLPLDLPGAP
jgi:signal transduction histidine kinase